MRKSETYETIDRYLQNEMSREERTVFEAEHIRDFKNGFALILGGSTRNKIIPMQSFYRGGSSETIHIKRYSPITF